MIKISVEGGESAGVSDFQWSTSEQIWPYEIAGDGSTLYCKQINAGTMPNNGTLEVAHNIADPKKIFKVEVFMVSDSLNRWYPLPYSTLVDSQGLSIYTTDTKLGFSCSNDWSAFSGVAKIIYDK